MRNGNLLVIGTAVIAIIFNVVGAGLVFIQPDERGVVVTIRSGGVKNDALQAGLNWVIPYAESVRKYSISRNTYTMSIAPSEGQISGDDSVEARTSDGQVVLVDASVIFSVDQSQVVRVHILWGDRYIDDLIRPLARGAIRNAVAQFRVDEVYSSQRGALTALITEELVVRLSEGGIVLEDFVLRNVAFSNEYAASLEQKQIAEQLALQAAFVVEQRIQEANQARESARGLADAQVIRAEGQAQARIIEANAEAEALALLGSAIEANPDVLTLQYIDKLSPGIEVMLLPSDNPFILQLPSINGTGVSP
jgi:regulator of protease activity HflC (stomatin/prohibitin superfamily)